MAGVANLFTEEFYALARDRLNPGGLFCQWVQAYRLSTDEFYRVAIRHHLHNTIVAAGNAEQIQGRAVFERVRGNQTEAAVAGHGSRRLRDDMHRRLRQSCEDLLRTGEVELSQIRKDDEAYIEE